MKVKFAYTPTFSMNGEFAIINMQQRVDPNFHPPLTYTSLRARHVETGVIIDVHESGSLMKHIALNADWDGKGEPIVGQNVMVYGEIRKLKYLSAKNDQGVSRLAIVETSKGFDASTTLASLEAVDRLTQQQKSAIEDIEHYCQNGAFNQDTADKMIELIKQESTKS